MKKAASQFLRCQLVVFLLLVISVVFCYFFIDRQVVTYLHAHHSRQWFFLHWLSDTTVNVCKYVFMLIVSWLWLFGAAFSSSNFTKKLQQWVGVVAVAFFLKVWLKSIFSRVWTATFICNNPSFVRDGVYGFRWLAKSSPAFESFPSGHATIIAAAMVMFGHFFPRYRWCFYVIIAGVGLAQIILYYHFVSDVLAGLWLGSVTAIVALRLAASD